jgi:hypothetical protein
MTVPKVAYSNKFTHVSCLDTDANVGVPANVVLLILLVGADANNGSRFSIATAKTLL